MSKKLIAITLLLFVAECLLGWHLYKSVQKFRVDNNLEKIQPARDIKQTMVPEKSLPRLTQSANSTPSDFRIIPENNVFSESRTRDANADAGAAAATPQLAQKPILVGISIIDNQSRASIVDPTSVSQGRNRRAQVKRVGDSYHGYMITEIAPNYIVLESGTRKEIIPLREGSKKPQGGKTAILSTRVVSFGGGAASGGTPVTVVPTSPAPIRTAASPVASSAQATAVQYVTGTPVAAQPRPSSANVPPTQPSMPVTTTETDPQGRRIIRTPFGNIVRPDRE